MAAMSDVSGLFQFFRLCGKLKHLKRTGWVDNSVTDPETVAGHMYRMAMMAFLFGSGGVGNDTKINTGVVMLTQPLGLVPVCGKPVLVRVCIKMALVHDLGESVVGDLTPHCGVSREEKHQREKEAMLGIKKLLPDKIGSEVYSLWQEYEDGVTPEAIVVKDLDKFDMVFQALEYETDQHRSGDLQQFFDSTKGCFQTPAVQRWAQELDRQRQEEQQRQEQNKPCTDHQQ